MVNEELVQMYQLGDKDALNDLIANNTGIVNMIINKFYIKSNSFDRDDLFQEGCIGLILAAEKYKPNLDKPCKFITYAVYWIYQKINRFIKRKNTNEETSLNAPTSNDSDNQLMDYIEGVDYSFENIEEKIYIQQLHEELDKVLDKHTTLQEREILKMHYGWDVSNCMMLHEIGDIFGITRSRAVQLENKALRKIRQSPWGRHIANELRGQRAVEGRYDILDAMEKINSPCIYI